MSAPAIANQNNELIKDVIGADLTDRGLFNQGFAYKKGDVVYIEKAGIKYYFGAKIDAPNYAPPNRIQWEQDRCPKNLRGCELRWATDGSAKGGIIPGRLPWGGFLATNKLVQ